MFWMAAMGKKMRFAVKILHGHAPLYAGMVADESACDNRRTRIRADRTPRCLCRSTSRRLLRQQVVDPKLLRAFDIPLTKIRDATRQST